jgi:hypothetical protein
MCVVGVRDPRLEPTVEDLVNPGVSDPLRILSGS